MSKETELIILLKEFEELESHVKVLIRRVNDLEKEKEKDRSWVTACHYRDQLARAREFIFNMAEFSGCPEKRLVLFLPEADLVKAWQHEVLENKK
jgi:hypothetical protein